MLLGAVLILSALLLVIHNKKEDEDAGEASYEAVTEIKEAIRQAIEGSSAPDPADPTGTEQAQLSERPQGTEAAYTLGPGERPRPGGTQGPNDPASPDNTPAPSASEAPQPSIDPYTDHVDPYNEQAVYESYEMETIKIHGYEYIGYITIPAIKLELPVMAKWDYTRLRIAPCVHFGSYKSGDLVIAGHNFERHFWNIQKLGHGDLLILTTAEGKIRTYVCTQVRIIEPYEIDRLLAGEWDLILYTCTYGGRHRVVAKFTEVPVDSIDISNYI